MRFAHLKAQILGLGGLWASSFRPGHIDISQEDYGSQSRAFLLFCFDSFPELSGTLSGLARILWGGMEAREEMLTA